jgi:heptaprenyl diphosphate synthase
MTKENITEKEKNEYTTYDEGMLQVEALLNKTLLSAPEIIRSQTGYLTRSRGKFIRAASNLASAENNDKLIHSDAVKVAAAIELLHLATLVHDDVIDNAKTRRGIATVQNKFGRRSAVICGDYLLCLSLKTALP